MEKILFQGNTFERRRSVVLAVKWTKELADDPVGWPHWLTTRTNGIDMDYFTKLDERRAYVMTKEGWTRVPFDSYIVREHCEFHVMSADDFDHAFQAVTLIPLDDRDYIPPHTEK